MDGWYQKLVHVPETCTIGSTHYTSSEIWYKKESGQQSQLVVGLLGGYHVSWVTVSY